METDDTTEYLGDGVYASYDGYHIWLRTDRGYAVHEIALEPNVYATLTQYVSKLKKRNESNANH